MIGRSTSHASFTLYLGHRVMWLSILGTLSSLAIAQDTSSVFSSFFCPQWASAGTANCWLLQSSRSAVECSLLCSGRSDCKSFRFDKSNGNCHACSGDPSSLVTAPQRVYCSENQVQPTTTTVSK